jgi:hypothetical protein
MKILIIDDEEVLRDVLDAVLRREGFEVIPAASGEEGLACLDQEDIDLIILDMMLPGMSGSEVLRVVRQTNPEIPGRDHHRLLLDRRRDRRDEAGSVPLHPEAVQERGSRAHGQQGPRAAAPLQREPAAQGRAVGEVLLLEHHRKERADAEDLRPDPARRPFALQHPDRGRVGNGQGTGRQGDPSRFAAGADAVRHGQLGLAPPRASGVEPVRPHQGGVHRRHRHQEGTVRGRRRRDRSFSTRSARSISRLRPSCCG